MRVRVALVVVLLFLAAGTCAVRGQYQQPKASEYVKILEDPHRIERLNPPEIVSRIGLQPGQTVADIGSGSGLFTRLMARAVSPAGRVYAVDIDPDLLAHVARTAAAEDITNIKTVLAPPNSPSLPPSSLDLALICDTLHHIEKKETYLRRLHDCIKPGGRLVIIDFSDGWPRGHESLRFTLDELREWIRSAGYSNESEFGEIEGNFFHIYRRP